MDLTVKEAHAKEALASYERALTDALEPMDLALQASDQAGEALLARNLQGHVKAMWLVLAAIGKTYIALLENGKHVGPVFCEITGERDQDVAARLANSSSQLSKSLEDATSALKAFEQISDPKETFTQYAQALSEYISNLGRLQKTLKDMAQPLKETLHFEEALDEAGRTKSKVWKAGRDAVAQIAGRSGVEQAQLVASAVYGEALAQSNDQKTMVQAQALALSFLEIALEQMFKAMREAVGVYKQALSAS